MQGHLRGGAPPANEGEGDTVICRVFAARPKRLRQLGLGVIVGVMFAVMGPGSALAEVTGAADSLRTGWYPDEPSLTPALLSGGSFQQVFNRALQGQIYAQPLVANGTLLVATEDNWIYGLDPNSGAVRWEKQLGTPVQSEVAPIECPDLAPRIGITGTPVIDTEHDIAYLASNSYEPGGSKSIAWYMHAVELSSGNEVQGFPVKITGKATNLPSVEFEAAQELQRPGLLMMNGVVYAGFGSHCDKGPYHGWIAGVSTSGQLTTMWASSKKGGSIWQSGGGLISDGPGQILFSTGNGEGNPGEGDPKQGKGKEPPEDLGDSVVRVAVQPDGSLKASDFFSPSNNFELDKEDLDLGSAAPIALPSQFGTASIPNLLVQPSKKGDLYLLNRDELGGMGQGLGGTDKVIQNVGKYGGVWDGSTVWPGDGNYVYVPGVAPYGTGATAGGAIDRLRFFKYGVDVEGKPSLSLAAESPEEFAFGSGSPIVTSNGTTNGTGILWLTQCPPAFPASCKESKLRAYSAVPVAGAPQALFSESIGQATKFSRPDASNSHVYVGNREGHIFGFSGPSLTPSTTSLAFGAVAVGSRIIRQVTFTNTGRKLKISAVRPPSAPFNATGLPPVGSTIEPGQTITVEVAFQASALGIFTGSLGLTTEAGETNIGLSGSAAESSPAPPVTGSAAPLTQIPASLNGVVSSAQTGKPSSGPDVKLASTSLTASSSGTLTVKVTCPASESSCTGTIMLRTIAAVVVSVAGHRSKRPKAAILTLAVGSFSVAGGRTATLKLHMSAKARALLARSHVLRARATIITRDTNGGTHTVQTIVTIRAAKARHRR
ncbi:MAG TPA: choice-of-anchor D domain-containing protein [Solirubrobacteraceae bacterium]|jgi:iron transport multicopper oxidase